MKKSTKNLLFLTSAVIAGMHIYNRVVKRASCTAAL